MKELGENLKAIRLQRNMTLEELSRRANVSKSQLSQIERNASTPTVTRLTKIADALEISISKLFPDSTQSDGGTSADGGKTRSKFIGVVRSTERRTVLMPWGGWYEILSPDLRHRIEFLYLHYPVGTAAKELYVHEGEECGLLLEGRFKGNFENREIILEPGDSIYYDSSIPHCWENAGDTDVRAIWVITPPSF